MKYDYKKIEKKWQDIWDEKGTFHAVNDYSKPNIMRSSSFPIRRDRDCTSVIRALIPRWI